TREAAIAGWNTPGYDDSKWINAREIKLEGAAYLGNFPDGRGSINEFSYDNMSLVGQIGDNAGIFEILTAKSVREVREGVFVYDMGQNLVGIPEITIENGKSGNKIILRVSEMLYPDLEESGNNVGMIMTENYRAALSQDIYIMKDGLQVFQPHFTFHGYQYLEITGLEEPLPLEAVRGLTISSVKEITADYKTSNDKVNRLWSNIVWSNVDNFLSIPTDCPQRNERMGWSGDLSVFSRTATYISNSDPFLRRHMYAMRDVQTSTGKFTDIAPVGGGFGGILWGSAGITVPWEVYQQYNDIKLLEEHYNAMSDYIDYLATTINEETGFSSDSQLGDWLGPQNNQLGSAFLATAYHIYDLWIMINVAEILSKDTDVEKYRKMYDERKNFFNKTFVNEDHKTLGLIGGGFGPMSTPGRSQELKIADTQTSYAVGLALGAFSDDNLPYMVKKLAETVKRSNIDDYGISRPEYSLMTGFIGTAWISIALSDYGHNDLAYRLLQNNQYPSWLYPVDQGATTIWERLNGYTVENGFGGNNSMNSFNHYSFGAVGQWMIAYSLGIQRDKPGFKHFVLSPEPDPDGKMTWAEGYYDGMYGRINSSWSTDLEKGTLSYKATIPANSTATLYMPAVSEKAVTENGIPASEAEGIRFVKYENDRAIYELKSGSYTFTSQFREDVLVPLK
ncbi:MAG: family 78 glycoside hydrolase catalytic domain, partial [Bacteroidales bacterium]|nr:family 78 glycoside hydrolase catalytic domain [Bacteroidales bacterium]